MERLAALAGALALVALAGVATATIQYSTQTTITGTATAPPIQLALGNGADRARFMDSVTISPNATAFTAEHSSRVGGDSHVKDVVRLTNPGAASATVTIRATNLSMPGVSIYTWTIKDGGTTVATLDVRAASPEASFTAATGTTYKLDLRVKTDKLVTLESVDFTTNVWMAVP